MPEVIPAVVAAVKAITVKEVIKQVAIAIGVNLLLGAVSKKLAGKRRGQQSTPPQQITVRDTAAARAVVYGECRVGGNVIYYTTTGDKNKDLWFVVAVAGHQVESITDVWLENERIPDSSINPTTGAVSGTRFDGKLRIWRHSGSSAQTANSYLTAATSEWTSAHRGSGVAYAIIHMVYDSETYANGAPQNFFFLVRGRRVYDPRLDSTNGGSGPHRLTDATTWEWSANPALCMADYMTGGSIWYDVATPDPRLGVRIPSSRIDWASVAAAANECDESVSVPSGSQARYQIGALFTSDEPHEQILDAIADTMAGPLPVFWGGRYRIYAGQYHTPTDTITDGDLAQQGYQITGCADWKSRYNAVIAEYTDAARDWQQVECRMRTSASYETEDGRRIVQSIVLRGVTNEYRAQRIAYQKLLASRSQVTLQATLGLNGLRLRPWQTVNVTLTEEGWTNKTFRIVAMTLNTADRTVSITAVEESSSQWADPGSYDDPATGASVAVFVAPDDPSGFTAVGTRDGINFRWTLPSNAPPDLFAELFEHTSASPFSSASRIWRGKDSQAFIDKVDTTTRYYWLRLSAAGGVYSGVTPSGDGVPAAAAEITGGFRATASPSYVTGSIVDNPVVTSDPTTASPVNGTSPFTYAWTRISGDTGINADSASSATTTFTRSGCVYDVVYAAVFRCTITDNTSATATVDVGVSLINIDPNP